MDKIKKLAMKIDSEQIFETTWIHLHELKIKSPHLVALFRDDPGTQPCHYLNFIVL